MPLCSDIKPKNKCILNTEVLNVKMGVM